MTAGNASPVDSPPELELGGLTLPELLDQLEDVVVPAPVPYTPETFGWVLVAAAIAGSLAVTALLIARRRRARAYRRAALNELSAIESRFGDTAPTNRDVTAIATLVRRTALAAFPREDVAHLYGDEWKTFLTSTADAELDGNLDALVSGPYRADAEIDLKAASRAARSWIVRHRA